MDKAIITIMLTIAGIVSVMVVMNAVYPALTRSTGSVKDAAGTATQRIKSQISIIHATGELDDQGVWNDINNDGNFDVFIWVKNVGSARILAIDQLDLFFGEEGDFTRYHYVGYAGGSLPYWTYQIENDTEWGPTATLRINLNFGSALPSGTYLVKVVLPVGVSDDHFFGM